MKVLAVVASPLGKGNTYQAVKQVEEKMKKMDEKVVFEYLILKDLDLKTCKGCFQCVQRGEQFCSIQDDRTQIEEKMMNCDGMIFASPVYVYNMSWMAKNFVDRFSYISHRPRFHGKKAMVVATTGAVGLDFTLFALSFPLRIWGFDVAAKLGVKCPTGNIQKEELEKLKTKKGEAIDGSSKKFYDALQSKRKPASGVLDIVAFSLQKAAFSNAEKDSCDYIYWKEKGWFEPKAYYYCDAQIGIFKRVLGYFIGKAALLNMPKASPRERTTK